MSHSPKHALQSEPQLAAGRVDAVLGHHEVRQRREQQHPVQRRLKDHHEFHIHASEIDEEGTIVEEAHDCMICGEVRWKRVFLLP